MKPVLIGAAAATVMGAPLAALAVAGSPVPAVASADAVADIPPGMLALYQRSAQRCPGLPWAVLAAVAKVESDHGRSTAPGVRSGSNAAGAAGPMQFGIGGRAGDTWSSYGVDGDGNGSRNVYDAADAVPAAADYLCAYGGGARERLSEAIFAYNHADWYVADVLAQATAYTALPPPVAGPASARAAIAFA